MKLRSAALALGLGLLAARPAAAEPTPIRGTHVLLEVPAGFEASSEFPGLGREQDLTSVLVTELPLPLESASASFTREALAERGVLLHRSVPVVVDSRPGTLLHTTQRAAGTTFRKWLLLFGEGGASVLITATTPLDLESVHGEALVSVLRNARWRPASGVGSGADLRFRVRGAPPFEVVTTSENAVVLADPHHDPGSGELPPLISVGSSRGRVHIADLPEFSRQRLQETATIDEIEVRERHERWLGGLAGYELVADARDVETQRPVHVRHVLATDGERYFLVQGIFDAAGAERHATAFEQVVESFATTAP